LRPQKFRQQYESINNEFGPFDWAEFSLKENRSINVVYPAGALREFATESFPPSHGTLARIGSNGAQKTN